MHFNYYFLKQLTRRLQEDLAGLMLRDCFSQNKDELVLIFHSAEKELIIKASLGNDIALLTFPGQFKRAKRNSINLFPEIINSRVSEIIQYKHERSFGITFASGFQLLFKLHGRRANLCLFGGQGFISMFRNSLINDKRIVPHSLHRSIDQSREAINSPKFDLSATFPTFDKDIKAYLHQSDIEHLSPAERFELIKKTLQMLNHGKYYIDDHEKGYPILSLLPPANTEAEVYTDPLEACNALAKRYFNHYLLAKEKARELRRIDREIKKSESYASKSRAKLQALMSGIKNNEIADILMANLHLKPPYGRSIELFDFYRKQPITIKLKEGMSLQANAEVYYRKAKNQQIELDTLHKNITAKKERILELLDKQAQIKGAENLKQLRKMPGMKEPNARRGAGKPYIEYMVDNRNVWVGKSAKHNDELLRAYSSREDVWLHARNAAGSHVLIKQGGGAIALPTIEKAAQIAAWYSKGKNDTLCPVVYTRRKYINKPKGAAAGQVSVQREKVMLVKPCQNPQ